jgi:hypothetical protein
MPAMPIAERSAPIVVGIRATSSAIRTVWDCGERVDRVRLQGHDRREEGDREPREQDVEGDLVRCLAALGAFDEGDHPVEERLAGLLRHLHHEPVGEQLRTAGDGRAVPARLADDRRRLTGDRRLVDRADSLDDLAVGGDDHARLDDNDVVALELGSRDLLEGAVGTAAMGGSRRPGRAQRVCLRLAAPLGDGLGEVREEHREPEPERDHAYEPERARVPANDVEHEDPGGDDAPELHDEHHRVADLMPWIELRERVADRSDDDRA